jgi:hypothetical protein
MKSTYEMWIAWQEATRVGVDEWRGRLPKTREEWHEFRAWNKALSAINWAKRR